MDPLIATIIRFSEMRLNVNLTEYEAQLYESACVVAYLYNKKIEFGLRQQLKEGFNYDPGSEDSTVE